MVFVYCWALHVVTLKVRSRVCVFFGGRALDAKHVTAVVGISNLVQVVVNLIVNASHSHLCAFCSNALAAARARRQGHSNQPVVLLLLQLWLVVLILAVVVVLF